MLVDRGHDDDLDRAAELTEEAVEAARSLGLGGVLRRAELIKSETESLPTPRPSNGE
jgi:hypothetical protein